MKNKCDYFRHQIPQYSSGALDTKAAAKLQKHIAKCSECSSLLDAQFNSMDGSGKLYILATTSDNAIKKSAKRKTVMISAITIIGIIIAALITAACLRAAGFVRISSVKFNECSLEYIQSEYPDILITESDLIIAAKAAAAYKVYLENPTTAHFTFEISNSEAKKLGCIGRNVSTGYLPGSIMICYKTAFHSYRITWYENVEPTLTNIEKFRFTRFKIIEYIQAKIIGTTGNEYFSEYVETTDFWGTLTRQELNG
ncbi:MAG: hypothetical protein IKT47_00615 [Oscillospiraceae bacterium]|nr:hypothetical protein [Oscillospiraceae bacterium]